MLTFKIWDCPTHCPESCYLAGLVSRRDISLLAAVATSTIGTAACIANPIHLSLGWCCVSSQRSPPHIAARSLAGTVNDILDPSDADISLGSESLALGPSAPVDIGYELI